MHFFKKILVFKTFYILHFNYSQLILIPHHKELSYNDLMESLEIIVLPKSNVVTYDYR